MDHSKEMADCLALLQSFDSVLLSTVCENAEPLASFSPYVRVRGYFYILVSELAEHTRNMQINPKASLMFIESEASAKNVYARKRAVIQVDVEQVSDDAQKKPIIELMREKHGQTVTLLAGLDDFKLFKLVPTKGRYVVGFGKAYDWDVVASTMSHISADVVKAQKLKSE